ncbi:MAG: geranylgeranyl reductase family protein [Bacteroidetes bacterium]|nr:geranylgeranyl reductase family protein [Bacteroidota bacterium]
MMFAHNVRFHHYDIAIIGAGPAGCAAALGLGKSGLKVALIDKAEFPREKICGDAIPGPAIKALKSTFPFFEKEFSKLKEKQRISSSRIMLSKERSIDYHWKLPAYNIKRHEFDAFLLQLVQKYASIDILTGWPVSEIKPGNPSLIKSEKKNASITAKLIIGCEGAGSITAKSFEHDVCINPGSVLAVRGYFKNVKLDTTRNIFYVSKKYLPGYFWVFPLGDDVFNIGFGMKADKHGKVKVKMKDALEEFIHSERMKDVFRGSEQVSEISAAVIPVGGKRGMYSGEGYLLAGDAARLADPLQGHGIDKAIVSALLAAHHSLKCFRENNFSAAFNEDYDIMIRIGLEKELRKNRRRQIMLSKCPALLNIYSLFRK